MKSIDVGVETADKTPGIEKMSTLWLPTDRPEARVGKHEHE
jgi:hypothetical protein